jgi:hypothetical protein
MTRTAIIFANAGAVAPYLPSNYRIVDSDVGADAAGDTTVIEGRDDAGWTLDGYVLPRLASGLIFGEEIR